MARVVTIGTLVLSLFLVSLSSCSTGTSAVSPVSDAAADSNAVDAAADAATDAGPADVAFDVDKSATCAATFGNALTVGFGRLDGTVVAVVPPGDQACALPNGTHLVIQVRMGGATYRMVVDVLSNQGSPDVLFHEIDAPLAAGAWADGWHGGASLDYVTTLNVHSEPFTAMHETDLVAKITSEIDVGAHVSVFATVGSTEPNSAHLVHRNLTNADGAIVVHPESAQAHYMLLRFSEQAF